MFKKVNNTVKSSLLYVRNATIIISVFITIFYLFAYFMNKDRLPVNYSRYEKSRNDMYTFVKNPEFQKSDAGKLQVSVYRNFLCYALGETCTDDPDDAAPYIKDSLLTKASVVFVAPYSQPPASGVLWAYESFQDAGFVPQTYAQGVGFYAIQPLAPIWKVFRNISYMILVLIVVTIGFMIMFKANINPQTVISIESAIPRIVLSLILITFSFPIAGFLIDVMYIIMGLGGSVIVQNISSTTGQSSDAIANALGWKDIYNSNGWDMFGSIIANGNLWDTGTAILSLVPFELQFIFRSLVSVVVIGVLTLHPTVKSFVSGSLLEPIPIFGGILGSAVGAVVVSILFGLFIGIIFPVILSFLVFITTLFLFFKIFFLLFTTYTKILLSIIFAPIILIFEAFPERNTFAYWIKGLFFNLLTFPIVAVLLLTAGLIANVSNSEWYAGNNANGELWRPPFLYSIEPSGFVMLVAISIIFLIPDMVAFVKKSFGVEDLPFNITPSKLLSGGAVAAAGGFGLLARSRSIFSELGVHRDMPSLAGLGPLRMFLPEDPNERIRSALAGRTPPAGVTPT